MEEDQDVPNKIKHIYYRLNEFHRNQISHDKGKFQYQSLKHLVYICLTVDSTYILKIDIHALFLTSSCSPPIHHIAVEEQCAFSPW